MADTSPGAVIKASSLPAGCLPLSTTADSFLAGILTHLPGLLPFTAPSVNSYERLQPATWSGERLHTLRECKTSSHMAVMTG